MQITSMIDRSRRLFSNIFDCHPSKGPMIHVAYYFSGSPARNHQVQTAQWKKNQDIYILYSDNNINPNYLLRQKRSLQCCTRIRDIVSVIWSLFIGVGHSHWVRAIAGGTKPESGEWVGSWCLPSDSWCKMYESFLELLEFPTDVQILSLYSHQNKLGVTLWHRCPKSKS